MNSSEVSNANISDDKIDIFELWRELFKEKLTVFLTVSIVVVMAGIYAFLGPKSYEIKVAFEPAKQSDLQEIRYLDVVGIDEGLVYERVVKNLYPRTLAEQLSTQSKISELFAGQYQDEQIKNIMKTFSVNLPKDLKEGLLVNVPLLTEVTFKGDSPREVMLLAELTVALTASNVKAKFNKELQSLLSSKMILNTRRYEFELGKVKKNILAEIEKLIAVDDERRGNLLEEIVVLREKAEQDRLYKIQRLESSLLLAKTLKIVRPMDMDPLDHKDKDKYRSWFVSGQSSFWKGSLILNAELVSLKARKSNDPYISGLSELKRKVASLKINQRVVLLKARTDFISFSKKLRDLVAQKVKLERASIQIKNAEFSVFQLTYPLLKPTEPITPKKALILAISIVLGLMLGICIALIRREYNKRAV